MDEPFYVSPFLSPTGAPMLRAWRSTTDGSYRLRHWDEVECVVSADGHDVSMTWPPSVSDPDEFLAGTGLALAWRLRGELCLHASAVRIGGRAVLFAGPSGAGKSTVAAALALRGHAVIADDLVVVSRDQAARAARNESARLRLRPDAVSVLERFVARALPVIPSPSGAYFDLRPPASSSGDAAASAPIAAICFLDRNPSNAGRPRLSDIGGADAAMALISDSWASRLQDRALRQQEFDQTARLVDAVRVMQLSYDHSHHLDAVVEIVEHDVADGKYASAT